MNNRRELFRSAALLAGAAGTIGALPGSVRWAFAIDLEPGITILDAANHGKRYGWLEANRSGHQTYARLPVTLGR